VNSGPTFLATRQVAELVTSREQAKEEARALWEEGFTVVPAHPVDKRPVVSWAKYQAAEPPTEEVEYWLSSAKFSGCNWAIITGKQIVVVDADSDAAMAYVESNLTHTPRTVRTSKGKHYYFQADKNFEIRNGVNPDLRIDLRGSGGCVIAPGSIHESGHIYERQDDPGVDVDWRMLPKLSAHDLRKIDNFNVPKPQPVASGEGFGSFSVADAGSQIGSRNNDLASLVGRLAKSGLDRQLIEEKAHLFNSMGADPLPRQEVDQTINSLLDGTIPRNEQRSAVNQPVVDEPIEEAQKIILSPQPFVLQDPAKIPPRQWVYGRHYIRKFLSVTVAPGGTGKTAITLAEAVAMATGRDLMGIQTEKRRVWVWNLEDPLDELQRRIAAICQHFGVSQGELGDRLLVNSGRDEPLIMATNIAGTNILTPAADALTAHIIDLKIDCLIVDPFVSSHQLSENDNTAIDLVVKRWAQVANDGNCSIELVHHVRKGNAQVEASVSDARGASALVDAARHVRRLQRMTGKEAREAGIPEDQFWRYSREGDSKDNLAPPSVDDTWRQMVSVELANGDSVGVSEPWQWPDAFTNLSLKDVERVQRAIYASEWRASAQSSDWVGIAVANALDMDIDEPEVKAQVKVFIKAWIKSGALRELEKTDSARHKRKFVTVGQWITDGLIDE
jgi:hypothetical protein